MVKYRAFIDGASGGNPGDAGIGIIIYEDGREVLRESKYIGRQTNNYAEYTALLTLLEIAKKRGIKEIKVFTDSELMVKQIKGEYRVKNENLKKLVKKILAGRRYVDFCLEHMGREKNKEADRLAKKASKCAGKLK